MKKSWYLFTGVLFISILSCNGQPEKNSRDTKATTDIQHVTTLETTGKAVNEVTIHITKADFLMLVMDYEKNPDTWLYKGEIPCLIDFYADWCAPCRITSPILEELAKEYTGKIKIYKVDVEKERELAAVFGVQSLPTFLFCPMKGNPTISSGIASSPDATRIMFRQQIEKLLLKKGDTSEL